MRDPFLVSPGLARALHPIKQDPRGAHFDTDLRRGDPLDHGTDRHTSGAAEGRDYAYREYTKFEGSLAAAKALLFAGVSERPNPP
jgi:hypothetical protein